MQELDASKITSEQIVAAIQAAQKRAAGSTPESVAAYLEELAADAARDAESANEGDFIGRGAFASHKGDLEGQEAAYRTAAFLVRACLK